MKRFPTMPCLVVTAILAVLLTIGLTSPIMVEASCGSSVVTGSSGSSDSYPTPIPPDKTGVVNPDSWIPPDFDDMTKSTRPGEKIGMKDEIPFGLPRPAPEDQLGKGKAFAGGMALFIAGIKYNAGGILSPKPPGNKIDRIG